MHTLAFHNLCFGIAGIEQSSIRSFAGFCIATMALILLFSSLAIPVVLLPQLAQGHVEWSLTSGSLSV